MKTTYRGELKELKQRIADLKKWETDNTIDRIRKEVRIEQAEQRKTEITQ